MQKVFFPVLFFLAVFVNEVSAQSRLIWSATTSLPYSQITDPRSLAVDAAGNNYSVNYTESFLSLFNSYVFYAHDANGVKLWEYVNDSCLLDCNDKYFNIVPVENNGAIFIGAYDDITGTQIRLKRIDAQGTLLWQQFWISPFLSVQPVKAMLDHDGKLIVALSATVNLLDLEDFGVAKFDTAGGLLDWHIELPDAGTLPDPLSEVISGMAIDANNNIYCTGSGTASGDVKNYFFKIDENGNLEYRDENTYDGFNSGNCAIETDDNGHFYTLGFSGTKPQVEKYDDQNGTLIWSEEITKDSATVSNVGMAVVGNSVYVASNYTYFNAGGGNWDNKHYIVSKLNSSGSLQWQNEYFSDADSLAIQDGFGGACQFGVCDASLYLLSSQHADPVNNMLILHRTDLSGNTVWYDTASISSSAGYFNFDNNCDVYVTRTHNNSNFTGKYTTSPLSSINERLSLTDLTIYPNPTTGIFTVDLNSDQYKKAVVSIFNSMGKEIYTAELTSGKNEFSLSGSAAGIYFVQVSFDGTEKFSKVLVRQ